MRQEKEDVKHREYSLIYETKLERDQDGNFIGYDTKLFKINRMEEINTQYSSTKLGKVAFFQCLEKVERVRSFWEERISEPEPGTEDKEVTNYRDITLPPLLPTYV
ncbi:myosin light chain kinase family member 4-like [Terrapene carolina triunguis]|uniref:myosin light chain kinase family member 4-like n=1 Tax=Terrapene triunguis TaxID=2587831 RepID=UPI000CEF8CFB|nr:myosin light chain kinase family member 4-like [Terrapene carolina triunguis]